MRAGVSVRRAREQQWAGVGTGHLPVARDSWNTRAKTVAAYYRLFLGDDGLCCLVLDTLDNLVPRWYRLSVTSTHVMNTQWSDYRLDIVCAKLFWQSLATTWACYQLLSASSRFIDSSHRRRDDRFHERAAARERRRGRSPVSRPRWVYPPKVEESPLLYRETRITT